MEEGSGEVDINSILNNFAATMRNVEGNKIGNEEVNGDKETNIVKESSFAHKAPSSYATVVTNEQSQNKVNFRTLELEGSSTDDFELKIPES